VATGLARFPRPRAGTRRRRRAGGAVENWHSVLRPHLAVHRTLPPGLLALLAIWHNHQLNPRGLHQGQSPLRRSNLPDAPTDWLVALGYAPAADSAPPPPRRVSSRPPDASTVTFI